MCGIFGIISFNNKEFITKKSLMEQGLLASSVRGMDGTGVFMVPLERGKDKDFTLYKKPMPSADFLSLAFTDKIFKDIEYYKYVIGHTRAKTRGDATYNNTHPFTQEHITMVHNGTISNSWEMGGNSYLEVDSMAITKALAETEDRVKTLSSIEGAYALVWYDAKEDALFLARNSERPLYMVTSTPKELAVVGSELQMLTWLCARNGVEVSHKIDITPLTLVKFSDGLKFKALKYKPKEKVTPIYSGSEIPWGNWIKRKVETLSSKTEVITYDEIQIASLLSGSDLKKGSSVGFIIDAVTTKSNRSRHGTITGYMWVDPYINVEAHGVVLGGIQTDQIFNGVIIAVKKVGQNMSLVLSPNISKSANQEMSNNTKESTAIVTIPEVAGPYGPISLEEFTKLVEEGCAFCQGPIFQTDKLRWTSDSRPICITCTPKVQDSGALLN